MKVPLSDKTLPCGAVLKEFRSRLSLQARGALLLFALLLALAPSCNKDSKPTMSKVTFDANAGYSMLTRNVNVAVSDSGRTRYQMIADIWYIYDQGDSSRWFFPQGFLAKEIDTLKTMPARLSSDTAYYFTVQDKWLFTGHVKAVNEIGDQFSAKQLYWDKQSGTVYSDDTVTIVSGERRLTGSGFVANQDFSRYSFYNNSGVTEVDDDEL